MDVDFLDSTESKVQVPFIIPVLTPSRDQVVKLLQVLHVFVISESSGLFCIAKGFLLTCHDLWRPENDAMKNSPLWVSINPGVCHV